MGIIEQVLDLVPLAQRRPIALALILIALSFGGFRLRESAAMVGVNSTRIDVLEATEHDIVDSIEGLMRGQDLIICMLTLPGDESPLSCAAA